MEMCRCARDVSSKWTLLVFLLASSFLFPLDIDLAVFFSIYMTVGIYRGINLLSTLQDLQ
jgi:hypothetical protein